jgi:hypothetical protein
MWISNQNCTKDAREKIKNYPLKRMKTLCNSSDKETV